MIAKEYNSYLKENQFLNLIYHALIIPSIIKPIAIA
jgi:hypothetical protein